MTISSSYYTVIFLFIYLSILATIRPSQAFIHVHIKPTTVSLASTRTSTTNASGTILYYQSEGTAVLEMASASASSTTTTGMTKSSLQAQLPATMNVPRPSSKISNTIVEDISSLNELKYFLEEDERPVVIKFYAKWCKKCQQIGRQFDRLAMGMGDRIVDQQLIDGDVRFAQVECTPKSQAFIMKELQVQGVPTLQMYVGTHKLLNGGSSMKNIRKELAQIKRLRHDELRERAEIADDKILTGLIEESFYDSPDFLNEEW